MIAILLTVGLALSSNPSKDESKTNSSEQADHVKYADTFSLQQLLMTACKERQEDAERKCRESCDSNTQSAAASSSACGVNMNCEC
jgi:hypothetical protein